MEPIRSSLILNKMYFDKLEFIRRGEKNSNELRCAFEANISTSKEDHYRVALTLRGEKQDEYDLEMVLIGLFRIDTASEMKAEQKETIIRKNAIAILMPYLRSQLSIMTAQPEVESQILPPMNIAKMFEEAQENRK